MLTMLEVHLGEETIQGLRAGLRGVLLRPEDEGYDAIRQVWNGRVDRKPALIARCAGVADVIAAVHFAREHRIELSVRGTGHNAAGYAVSDGGLMIDLSPMKGIRIDPARRTARVQPGVTWGEFDHEAQAFGLATTGGRISTVGVGGLTLGGGYGWLMRKCGLAIDNLLSVDVVTADGSFVTASEAENSDLFWGVRGGGGNFGIATSFEFRLHRIGPIVTGGMAFYPAAQAKEVLQFYREFMGNAPDELAALFNFLFVPPAPFVPPHLRGVRVVAIAVCHFGSLEEAARDLAPLREIGPPLLERIKPRPYTAVQRMYDAAGEFGPHVYGRSGHLAGLGDNVVDILVDHAAQMTSPMSIVMISPLGGAVGRVGDEDTAFSYRQTAYDYAIDSVWTDPHDSDRHIAWTHDFWEALRPFSKGVYVNELGDEGEPRVREAYSPATYQRLVALKKKYDPDNVFHLNQNIKPE
ncbi:MAG: FAD-binding oxidoreductase [Chloroflexia bacterium]